jgi:hypothetical protein
MPRVNTPASAHAGPAAAAGWQWQAFANASYLAAVNSAIATINTRIRGIATCDAAFRALPGGKTFSQVWADPTVWISYDPTPTAQRYGATLGKEVTLSQYTCKMGSWTIVATLIHELAHVNGADGISNDAESTLQHCLMKDHYNPAIIGNIIRAKQANWEIAALSRSWRCRAS